MHKLIKTLFCIFSIMGCAMQADELSEAIKTSSVKKVSRLLYEQKPTAQQLVKYLDTAEQIMRMRRDNPGLGYYSSEDFSSNPYPPLMFASVGVFVIATGILMTESAWNNRLLGMATTWLPLSGITLAASAIARDRFDQEMARTLHSNAITIQEMLYDYSVSLKF